MGDYYILDGHTAVPVDDVLIWGRLFESTDRHVASTTIGDIHISTVFLGLDHQWGVGPPLLFETMLFGGAQDEYQWRWSTWAEAEAGHERVVRAVRHFLETGDWHDPD